MSNAVARVDDETAQQSVTPPGKRKLILVAVPVVVAVLLLIAGSVWFLGILPHRATNTVRTLTSAAAEKPTLIDIPDIITNLDNGSHRAVFIKLKARIEVAHLSDQAVINMNMPRILDAFQTYLRSLRPEELHGGEGAYRLREALMNRINVIATPVQVLDVLFVEMLIQ